MERMRIEQLASRTGVTTRNIRAYQQRGLLPPPDLDGRVGYYGDEHLVRLRLIEQLQSRGFSLAAIEHTLQAWSRGGQLSHLIGFDNVLLAPFTEEPAEPATAQELFARFPEAAEDPALVERAVALGLVEPRDDGTFLITSPLVLQAGEALVGAGVPLARLLDVVAAVVDDVDDIADRFVTLVADEIVGPVVEGEDPGEQVEALRTVEQLRPIALEVVRPFLARALERRIDAEVRARGLLADPAE